MQGFGFKKRVLKERRVLGSVRRGMTQQELSTCTTSATQALPYLDP